MRCPQTRQIYIPNLKQITSVNPKIQVSKFQNNFFVFFLLIFLHFAYFLFLVTCERILLSSWNLVLVIRTNFGWNLIKIYGVMIDFSCEKRSKVCHTYRVNHWKELDETWHVVGVTIVEVSFCGLKWIRRKDHGDMTLNPTGVKITRSNLWIKICPVILQSFKIVYWTSLCIWSNHHRNSLQ